MLEKFHFIDINEFRKLKLIGEGGFGSVYCIKNKNDGKIYAAKIFYNICTNKDELKSMRNELAVYSNMNHPLIANYYGFCPYDFEKEPYSCLILDYYPNGSLESIVEKERKGLIIPKWNNTKKLINLYGIASGIAYLHSHKIMHRDIKLGNVLLDDNMYPKLCDYGISKNYINESETHTKYIGTPLYMAPELVNYVEHYSPAIDIYAFGMLVYILIFQIEQTVKILGQRSKTLFLREIKKGKRPKLPNNAPNCYKNLITKCWSQDPKDRPSITEIVELLKSNHEFVSELNVDEKEYYTYIKMVSGEIPYPNRTINEQQNLINSIIEENNKPLSIKIKSTNLDKYDRKKLIGEGSFGAIYEIEDKVTKIKYAAKISKREIYECTKKGNDAVNFVREVTIHSQIFHQAILKYIGYSPINFNGIAKPVIITELLKNGNLSNLIELERKGVSIPQLTDTKKLIIIYGIASAMEYLHRCEILHRDLKLENILLDDFLFPKLADFGLSNDYSNESNEELKHLLLTEIIGTPMYIAPEIYTEKYYSKASDIYAFAFIVYQIITADVPYVGKNKYQIMWDVCNGIRPKIKENISNGYKKLIVRC